MKKKSLMNIKGAGRPAKHDKGIRHTERELLKKLSSLHLTIKIERNKAGLKNKTVLAVLHKAIKNARKIGLGIIHYTLEYDHIHLLVEARDNETLGKGMQSFGICFSKGINKYKAVQGQVYKTRYHLRVLKTLKEIKNVLNYVFGNAVKHKSSSFINHYNSLAAVNDFSKLYPGFERTIEDTISRSQFLLKLKQDLQSTLSPPEIYQLKYLI